MRVDELLEGISLLLCLFGRRREARNFDFQVIQPFFSFLNSCIRETFRFCVVFL